MLLKSLKHAGRGLKFVFKSELNFRIQTLAAAVAIILAFVFPLLRWERILIFLLIILVLLMEILNTAVEYLNDLLKPRLHHYVGVVKDIMAGAVLLVSLSALGIGLYIFLPYFLKLF